VKGKRERDNRNNKRHDEHSSTEPNQPMAGALPLIGPNTTTHLGWRPTHPKFLVHRRFGPVLFHLGKQARGFTATRNA
jgi:hypothetical protein